MFSARIKPALYALGVALFTPAAALAQAPETQPSVAEAQAATAPEDAAAAAEQQMAGWYTEIQGLHQRLQELQDRALDDPQLHEEQEALGREIQAAVTVRDSMMPAKLERMNTLQAEAQAASAANDMNRLQELMLEATDIRDQMFDLQRQVLEQPEIAAKVGVFQTALQAKMVQIEPEAQRLMDRFRELESMLAGAMGGPTN